MGGGTMHIEPPNPITRLKTSTSPSSSSNLNLPVSASTAAPAKPACSASFCSSIGETCRKLEAVNGRKQDITASGSFSHSVFGLVPSPSEVERAISVLQNFMHALSSHGSDSSILLSSGLRRVYDAFQMLQTDPSLKRLVFSLSSDKALWDAIMNNELVRKLREPLCSAETERRHITTEEPEITAAILQWILDLTKVKVMELIGKFLSLMNDMFQTRKFEKENPVGEEDEKDQFEDKVRSSLLLSVVILFVVVVTRANMA